MDAKKYYLILLISAVVNTLHAQPQIMSVLPLSGPVGSSVNITGSNFNELAKNNIVFFGATQAVVTFSSSTLVSVMVPFGATYEYVTVTDLGTSLSCLSPLPFCPTLTCTYPLHAGWLSKRINFPTDKPPFRMAIGDINGDGSIDLTVGYEEDSIVSIFINASSPRTISFKPKIDFICGSHTQRILLCDLDGDGKPDIVVTNGNHNTLSISRNTSDNGMISFETKIDYSTGLSPNAIAIADLNGDGKLDIAVANEVSATFSIFMNKSDHGSISFVEKHEILGGEGQIACGDLDGDGKSDLIGLGFALRNTSSIDSISFAPKVAFETASSNECIALGDLDGNGKLDLAIASSGNTVAILENRSDFGRISFADPVEYDEMSSSYLSIADMDGDGKPEIITSYGILKNVSTVDSISFANSIISAGQTAAKIAIGDFDSDGKLDIAAVSNNYKRVSIHRNLISPPTPSICIVSVDTVSKKNVIIWSIPSSNFKGYYNVYKEVATNNFDRIGSVPNGISSFIDYMSKPESHGDKYVIEEIDSCGNVSGKSEYHMTMNLVISNYGNTTGLTWTPYKDNSGEFIPGKYYIYRGSKIGQMQLLDSISASFTSYNDVEVHGSFYYLVAVRKPGGCLLKTGFSESFSNFIKSNTSSIFESYPRSLQFYPNPTRGIITIATDEIATIEILNIQGIVLIGGESINFKSAIDLSKLSNGLYFLRIKIGKSTTIKKLVKIS